MNMGKPGFLTSLPAVQGRTEHMSADGRYGVGMRWLVLTPGLSPESGEGRGVETQRCCA